MQLLIIIVWNEQFITADWLYQYAAGCHCRNSCCVCFEFRFSSNVHQTLQLSQGSRCSECRCSNCSDNINVTPAHWMSIYRTFVRSRLTCGWYIQCLWITDGRCQEFSVMACPHWHWSQSQQKSWLLSPSSSGLSGNYSPGIWGAPASTLVWGSRDTEPLVGGRGKHANPKAFSLLADQGIRQICFLFKEFANSLEDKSVPRFATFVSSFYQSRTGIAYILCLSVSMSVCLSVYMYVNFRFFCDYTSLYLLRDVTLRTVIAKFTEKVETELRKVDK